MRCRRVALQVLSVASVAAFLLAGTAAFAGDSDGDGIADDVENATARNVLARGGPDSFFIRSRSVGATPDDVFEIDYSKGEFEVSYARQSGGPAGVSYRIEFRRLVEFVDDGGPVIDGGDIVNETDLSSEYSGVRQGNATTADGETLMLYTATTTSGVFAVTARAGERFAKVGDGLMTPMEAKLDLEIRGWSFQQPGTTLALEIDVRTGETPRIEDTTQDEARGWAADESQLNITGPDGSIFFSWAETATVDGESRPVRATSLVSNTEGYEFYLIYGRGVSIVHDPKMGVESAAFWSIWYERGATPLQPDVTLYAIGLIAVAAVVGATVFLRRRRRNE